MRGEIRRLCKEAGLTAIYVSHDQKEALAIGDRVVVMDAGKIRQIGAPLEVYRKPQSRFVAEFLGETNLIEGQGSGAAVSTEIGMFEVPANGPVLLSVHGPRPGGSPRSAGASNSFAGKIIETVYLGEMARHRFAAESGRELIVFEMNPRRAQAGEAPIYNRRLRRRGPHRRAMKGILPFAILLAVLLLGPILLHRGCR